MTPFAERHQADPYETFVMNTVPSGFNQHATIPCKRKTNPHVDHAVVCISSEKRKNGFVCRRTILSDRARRRNPKTRATRSTSSRVVKTFVRLRQTIVLLDVWREDHRTYCLGRFARHTSPSKTTHGVYIHTHTVRPASFGSGT